MVTWCEFSLNLGKEQEFYTKDKENDCPNQHEIVYTASHQYQSEFTHLLNKLCLLL